MAGESAGTEPGEALPAAPPDARLSAGGRQREAGRRAPQPEPRDDPSVRNVPLSPLRRPEPRSAPGVCHEAHGAGPMETAATRVAARAERERRDDRRHTARWSWGRGQQHGRVVARADVYLDDTAGEIGRAHV